MTCLRPLGVNVPTDPPGAQQSTPQPQLGLGNSVVGDGHHIMPKSAHPFTAKMLSELSVLDMGPETH